MIEAINNEFIIIQLKFKVGELFGEFLVPETLRTKVRVCVLTVRCLDEFHKSICPIEETLHAAHLLSNDTLSPSAPMLHFEQHYQRLLQRF